jgi:hypothetical protein
MANDAHKKGIPQTFMEKGVRKDIDIVFQTQEAHNGNSVPSEKTDVKSRGDGKKAKNTKEYIKGGNINKGYKTLFFLRT